VKISVNLL
jgi:predicted transcriptional regulator